MARFRRTTKLTQLAVALAVVLATPLTAAGVVLATQLFVPLPAVIPDPEAGSMGGEEENVPYWGQDEVHDIYRDWNRVLAEYDGDRALCGEAWLPTLQKTALIIILAFTSVGISAGLKLRQTLTVRATRDAGEIQEFTVICRIDTPAELEYYRHGGILEFVLRQLLQS